MDEYLKENLVKICLTTLISTAMVVTIVKLMGL